MKQQFPHIITLYLIILLTAFSCSKDPLPDPPINISEKRTLLVYIALNNSLSGEIQDIHNALKEGWNSKTMGSLVILTHSRGDDSPMLIKFREHKNETVADTLKWYTGMSSASPELISQVIADTKEIAPSESYGMLLFSHASGWLPARAYIDPIEWETQASRRSSMITTYSIFEDNKQEMEFADFAKAIPDGMFKFIASEMCFMSSVETAYALRNKTDYLLAAAPEVLSPGFTPIYPTQLGLLYKEEPDLKGFGQSFFDYFNGQQGLSQSAAISLIRTSEMEALAELTHRISLPSLTQEQIDNIQEYDGNYRNTSWPHLFFDFEDYMSQNATPQQLEELKEQLSKTVIFKRNTSKLIYIQIRKHSGLSVYIPQASMPKLNEAYMETDWWKAVN